MREIGFVDEVQENYAIVKVAKKSACGENCASCKGGCVPGERRIKVKNKISVQKGDKVILEMPECKVLSAAFFAYILPILIFFAGYFLGEYIFKTEGCAIFCGIITMVCGFLIIHFFDRKNREKYMAEIVEKQ